jgi:hypothetical protein
MSATMKRNLLAVLAALISWVGVVSILNVALRHLIAGYAAGEPQFAFTTGMLAARLIIAAVSSLAAGAVTAAIAPAGLRAAAIAGAILLAMFVSEHVKLWNSFPLWYHLTFLVTLIPLVVLGASLVRSRHRSA